MLDPRIYRMALILPALALVVLAFSLRSQPAALHSSLSPAAYNAAAVAKQMTAIAADPKLPTLDAGSAGDQRLAGQVASSLRAGANFSVSTDRATTTTPQGPRTLESVVATRAGSLSGAGSIVIVAARDGRGAPTAAVTSPTATLVELSRVLGGETLRRTVVLASISGSQGDAGAIRLAGTLPRPIDAVVVLGDLASGGRRQPVVIPWSSDSTIAPPRLRNTLTAALRTQSSVRTSMPGVVAQLAHLAFPLTISSQGPLGAAQIPAVELSLSGESAAAGIGSPGRALSGGRLTGQLNAIGRSILTTVSALESGPTVPAPSTYVLFAGKVVPKWAMSLFVLALIVPVLLTMIDGIARARRRNYLVGRAALTVLAAAVPFAVAGLVVLIGGAAGALPALPSAIGARHGHDRRWCDRDARGRAAGRAGRGRRRAPGVRHAACPPGHPGVGRHPRGARHADGPRSAGTAGRPHRRRHCRRAAAGDVGSCGAAVDRQSVRGRADRARAASVAVGGRLRPAPRAARADRDAARRRAARRRPRRLLQPVARLRAWPGSPGRRCCSSRATPSRCGRGCSGR